MQPKNKNVLKSVLTRLINVLPDGETYRDAIKRLESVENEERNIQVEYDRTYTLLNKAREEAVAAEEGPNDVEMAMGGRKKRRTKKTKKTRRYTRRR